MILSKLEKSEQLKETKIKSVKKIIRRNNIYKKRLIKGQNKKRENKFKNKKGKSNKSPNKDRTIKTKQSWKNDGGEKANGRHKKS